MGEILNKRERDEIASVLNKQFGFRSFGDLILIRGGSDKLWITNREVLDIDFSKTRVETIGLYFGKVENGAIRLSIEGSQIVGKQANKNIIEINQEQLFMWLRGFDLEIPCESTYVLLKYKNDFVGCGKRKVDGILNFVPKDRRIRSLKELPDDE
jgi:NOL1/NOP2/fmu family ribosome biogenesis protein